ncbi:MAG: hypothetical protein IJ927_01095, partial [Eubacterium sp.]|nr:hypothetical protein [Eubacterium sp.]
LCLSMVVCAFGACAKNNDEKTTGINQATTEEMTTDSAVIKEADAINLIKSYSDDELGLTAEDRKKASFMVASNGVKIEKDNYIEVIATIKNEHKEGDKITYTFDNLGVYYIRYDGKKIMRLDMKSEEEKYIEMKIKAVPTTTAPAETEAKTETETQTTKG